MFTRRTAIESAKPLQGSAAVASPEQGSSGVEEVVPEADPVSSPLQALAEEVMALLQQRREWSYQTRTAP